MSDLPEAKTELEIRAKAQMTGEGFRHWMACRLGGTCAACNLPLPVQVEGEPVKVRRGIHDSCHRLTYYHARKGAWTIEDRVREGKIDPGRPPHPLTQEARQEFGE